MWSHRWAFVAVYCSADSDRVVIVRWRSRDWRGTAGSVEESCLTLSDTIRWHHYMPVAVSRSEEGQAARQGGSAASPSSPTAAVSMLVFSPCANLPCKLSAGHLRQQTSECS